MPFQSGTQYIRFKLHFVKGGKSIIHQTERVCFIAFASLTFYPKLTFIWEEKFVYTGWQFNRLKKQLGGLLGAYLGAYLGAFPV